jgi:CTP synthase (UTP-ammonia lyase)
MAGMVKKTGRLPQILEFPDHPWFIDAQFHHPPQAARWRGEGRPLHTLLMLNGSLTIVLETLANR